MSEISLLVVPDDSGGSVQFRAGDENVQRIREDNEVLGPVEVGTLVVAGQVDVHTGQGNGRRRHGGD